MPVAFLRFDLEVALSAPDDLFPSAGFELLVGRFLESEADPAERGRRLPAHRATHAASIGAAVSEGGPDRERGKMGAVLEGAPKLFLAGRQVELHLGPEKLVCDVLVVVGASACFVGGARVAGRLALCGGVRLSTCVQGPGGEGRVERRIKASGLGEHGG